MVARRYSDEERTRRQTNSKRKWNKKHYKQINIMVTFEDYDTIMERCKESGKSFRQFALGRLKA